MITDQDGTPLRLYCELSHIYNENNTAVIRCIELKEDYADFEWLHHSGNSGRFLLFKDQVKSSNFIVI